MTPAASTPNQPNTRMIHNNIGLFKIHSGGAGLASMSGVFMDFATLHNEVDLLQDSNIGQGVAFYGN